MDGVIHVPLERQIQRNNRCTAFVTKVISWNVSDQESDITSQNGCDNTTITEDTDGIDLTCEATSEGGTSSESIEISRDATPPS